MAVYTFRQNNSGGRWTGPAMHILCEANDAKTANNMAEAAGAYFDGAGDCPCCGDRWSEAWGEPDYATVEEAVSNLENSKYRTPAWEEEAGGLYVIVRGGYQIESAS